MLCTIVSDVATNGNHKIELGSFRRMGGTATDMGTAQGAMQLATGGGWAPVGGLLYSRADARSGGTGSR